MSRLIDADIFKTEYENLITWVSHRAEKARLREFIKDIQNQPTVKAIPIEWIEKFMNRFRLDMVISDEYALLHFMLTEWENENEESSNSD